MVKHSAELSVGAFVVLGLLCLAYLALTLGELDIVGREMFEVTARFSSVSGLREGATVEIAGVRSGVVDRIALDPVTYEAVVSLALDPSVRLQTDSIASIRTAGIIGDKFVKIAPGGADEMIVAGGEIIETEGSISLEELISKYIFEGGSSAGSK
ncbi:MAG: outer membrane lipid asymmetry maintenance protein MlaD [Gammaproteobacteria bacterium]